MKKYKLGNILTISSTSITPQAGRTYHLYSLPSFDNGKIPEITKGENIQSNKYVVSNRCILFNKLNVRFKRIWRIENNAPNKLCSTEFLPLIIDESIIDYQYCYYLLASDDLTNYLCGINSNTSGSHKRINPDILLDLEVTLPVLDEQKRIGSILANLDRKIALNRSINHDLEAMAKQLYDYWFVQFDFPDENGKPYKSSGGKMVWNEKLKREIPVGWSDGQLSGIANIIMGQSPDGSSYNEVGNGKIFYQGSTDFGIRFPSIRQYTTAPTRFAKKRDILMSVRAPVGATNIANNDCCIGRGLAALNSKVGSITHLYYIIDGLKTAFDQRNAAGTTFGSITKDDLFVLPVVVPNTAVLLSFEKVCSAFFEKQMIIGEEIDLLTKLRDSLLPLLMNGQVSVNYDLSND